MALFIVSAPTSGQLPAPQVVPQQRAADDKAPLSLFPLVTAWTLALNDALAAAPSYDATRAFFAIEGDRIVAYDLTTGSQLWLARLRTALQPAIGEGRVFVAGPTALTALHAASGAVAWNLPFAESLDVPVVWDYGWLIAVTRSGDVLALRASDGHLLWRRHIGVGAQAPPTLFADRVYVPARDGRVIALNVETGAPIWERRLAGAPGDILASADRLFLGADKYFYCLDARDGSDRWRWRTGAVSVGRPAGDDRSVFFVALDNVLRALDRGSGAQQWKTSLPMRPSAGPLQASGLLIVTGLAPTLHAYGASDGKPAGELPIPGELAAPVHLLRDPFVPLPVLVVVTRDIVKGATVAGFRRQIDPPVVELNERF